MNHPVFLITGGLGRIGTALGERIETESGIAVQSSRDAEKVQVHNRMSEAAGQRKRAVLLEPQNDASIAAFVESLIDRFGRITGLVNNAYCALPEKPPEDVSMDDWATTARIDLGLAYRLSIELKTRQPPDTLHTIVNVASIYGMMAPDFSIYTRPRIPSMVTYGAMKAGLIQMTRYLAVYWAQDGVRVNSVTLGGVEDGQDQQFLEDYTAMVPSRRMITRQEAADTIYFLLGEQSSGITGANIVVDGGRHAW